MLQSVDTELRHMQSPCHAALNHSQSDGLVLMLQVSVAAGAAEQGGIPAGTGHARRPSFPAAPTSPRLSQVQLWLTIVAALSWSDHAKAACSNVLRISICS